MAQKVSFRLLFYLHITTMYIRGMELGNQERSVCSSNVEEVSNSTLSSQNWNKYSCPLWQYCKESHCQCAQNISGFIRCCNSGTNTSILGCNCITHDGEEDTTEVGRCVFNCKYSDYSSSLFVSMPSNVTELDEFICGPYNRTGTLCGKCKDGHYPLAYSFDMNCVECPNGKSNWWKFALAAFLPLTFWCIIVLLFRISVTSSQLHGFVFCVQGISVPAITRVTIIGTKNIPLLQKVVRCLGSLYGIWNLDFFRLFNHDICLGIDTLQTLSLDYLVGIYPFLLMITTYFLINLHDGNCKLLMWSWKPLSKMLTIFHKKWEIRTSLIDAFATFFLLSNIKFLSISFDILTPMKVYHLNKTGDVTHTWRVFSDATIPYFGEKHLPYALLAIAILTLLVFFPILLLILYPFHHFQKFLNLFPFRWYILHTFMDSFLGCYKDGTERGTRDCRWFASMFLIARLCIFLIGAVTADIMYFVLSPMLLVLVALFLHRTNPFKEHLKHYTENNIIFVLLLALWYATCIGNSWASYQRPVMAKFLYIQSGAVAVLPLLLLLCIIIHWIYSKRKSGVAIFWKICAWRHGYSILE